MLHTHYLALVVWVAFAALLAASPGWVALAGFGVAGLVWVAQLHLLRPTPLDKRVQELEAKVARLANRLGG